MQFAGNQPNGYSSDMAKLRNRDIDYPSHNDNESYNLPRIMCFLGYCTTHLNGPILIVELETTKRWPLLPYMQAPGVAGDTIILLEYQSILHYPWQLSKTKSLDKSPHSHPSIKI